MLFMGYGALLARSMVRNDSKELKRLGSITSGIGLVLIFIAGFGLMAKLYNNSFQSWMLIKIVIWLVLGGIIELINRSPCTRQTPLVGDYRNGRTLDLYGLYRPI